MYINTLPPLGLLYMASSLEARGIPCDVIDRNTGDMRRIEASRYSVIAFSVNLSNIVRSFESIRDVKSESPDTRMIVGGPSCISNPEYFLKNDCIDAVCVAEGEKSICDFVLRDGSATGAIDNLWIKDPDTGEVVRGSLKWIDDLDILPFPALNKVDLTRYRVPLSKHAPLSNITTSRGCPYGCIFCFHSMGRKWRARSAVNVVDEIEWQVNSLGIREMCIQDDNFSLDVRRAHEICDLIEDRGIKIKYQFINGIRLDKVDEELIKKFARIGVWYSVISPETGSERIMEKIKKGTTLKEIAETARLFKEAGIILYGAYMIGFPFEKREDILKTIEFAKKLDTTFAQFSIVTPLPKTELFDIAGCGDGDFDMEKGMFFGDVKCHVKGMTEAELKGMVKKAYRNFYLRPRKILELLRTLSWKKLFQLFIYSIKTRNI